MQTLLADTKVSVKWYDESKTILHFIVTGPRGGHKAGFFVRHKDLLTELERLESKRARLERIREICQPRSQ